MQKIHRALAVRDVAAHRSLRETESRQSLRSEPSGRLRGRLNLFQATMLRWRDLHPYNAVHVVRVDRPLSPGRLKRCLEARLESAGLTGLVLDRRRRRFEFLGGHAEIEPAILAAGEDTLRAVEREIEHQLNLAFPREGAFLPFRFFAAEAGRSSFYFGIAYDHFIAGGDSITVLLKKLCDDYADDGSRDTPRWAPRRYPRTYGRLFLRHLRPAVTGLARLPAMAASCRRSFRAPCHAKRDPANAFFSMRIGSVAFDAALRATKAWGVTVNDLLVAALLLALSPVTAKRGSTHHRKELTVASAVNLRGEFESSAEETFGQFLTSLRVSHPVPPGIGLRELATQVHTQTALIKARKLYLQTLLALGWMAFAWRFLGPDRQRRFLAKHHPIWAGVTSLNVDALWRGPAHSAPVTEYLRAVPTGPLAPLVVAATTFGGVLELGFSFRAADLSRDTLLRVADEFSSRIEKLE